MVGYRLGFLQIDDPLRLLSFIVIWLFIGASLLTGARRLPEGAYLMRMSDIPLFGPPLLLGAFGWGMVWLSERSDRNFNEQMRRQGPAE